MPKTRAFLFESLAELQMLGKFSQRFSVLDELSRIADSLLQDTEAPTILTATSGSYLLQEIYRMPHQAGRNPLNYLKSFIDTSLQTTQSTMMRLEGYPAARVQLLKTQEALKAVREGHIDVVKNSVAKGGVVGIKSSSRFFALERNSVLCDLLLHILRVDMQSTGLLVEQSLGGIAAAVHLAHSFKLVGSIIDFGRLGRLATQQGPDAFYFGQPPTKVEDVLKSYALSIGTSISTLAKQSRGMKKGVSVGQRAKSLIDRAPFARSLQQVIQDPHGRFTLRHENLLGLLKKNIPEHPFISALSNREQNSVTLLKAMMAGVSSEHVSLTFDYLQTQRVAWDGLDAVWDVVRPANRRETGVPSSEEVVGVLFGPSKGGLRRLPRRSRTRSRPREPSSVLTIRSILPDARRYGATGTGDQRTSSLGHT
ncbi:hypothetical protein QBC35DRAFT_478876 [Podospora australis]|uniref:Uncharacterized protein n=1 Tax=Podospora australis TaxID=1536484 RepID=A0AAN6WID2_9PEZI|nr:hypothetical protein QBC35DRAFT_478876 [Podospora australis]